MTKIFLVLMCGGSATRVWPESRETLPKQFIPLVGERSTFQTTIAMVADPAFEAPINKDYRFLIADQLRHIGAEANIVSLAPRFQRRRRAPGRCNGWLFGVALDEFYRASGRFTTNIYGPKLRDTMAVRSH
jgi:hypothetical protein